MSNHDRIHSDFDDAERFGRAVALVGALAFLLIALLWFGTSHAQAACAWSEDCLQWTAPTTYSDGSVLLGTDIGTYIVESAPAGSSTWTQLAVVTAPVQAYKRVGLKNNDAYQYRVSAVLKSGARSAPSNVQTATTIEPPPSTPTLKTIDALAYEIKTNSTGTLVATRIGLVPVGTACDAATRLVVAGIAYTRIPRDAVDVVNFSSLTGARAWIPDVYAKCS